MASRRHIIVLSWDACSAVTIEAKTADRSSIAPSTDARFRQILLKNSTVEAEGDR
jgi:hypothetical protein